MYKTYLIHIKELKKDADVIGKACPLFVPLVEEGLLEDPVTDEIAKRYLSELIDIDIDTLILGCTHYPFLRKIMERVIGDRAVEIIDSGSAVSRRVAQLLDENDIRAERGAAADCRFITLGDENYLKKLQRRAYGCCSKEEA